MEQDERDRIVADAVKAGRCAFGNLKEGQSIPHCPSGFPGCGCADELDLNPYLKDFGIDGRSSGSRPVDAGTDGREADEGERERSTEHVKSPNQSETQDGKTVKE